MSEQVDKEMNTVPIKCQVMGADDHRKYLGWATLYGTPVAAATGHTIDETKELLNAQLVSNIKFLDGPKRLGIMECIARKAANERRQQKVLPALATLLAVFLIGLLMGKLS